MLTNTIELSVYPSRYNLENLNFSSRFESNISYLLHDTNANFFFVLWRYDIPRTRGSIALVRLGKILINL